MRFDPSRCGLSQARVGGNATIEHASKLETLVEVGERAENTLRTLIESLPMGLIIADEKGKITDLNESSLRRFGYRRGEPLGQTIEILRPERLGRSHHGTRAR